MEEMDLKNLKLELEKARSQLYIFYELTQAMRTSLHLEEVAYIILTGLTAHHGLGFNRAVLFLIDERNQRINGFMGIGPMDSEEANEIWKAIENQRMDLYALIKAYHRIKEGKVKPKFMELTSSLSFPLNREAGILYEAIHQKNPLHIDITQREYKRHIQDPIVTRLDLNEFVVAPLWTQKSPLGLILVDNCITRKPIGEEDIRILAMFVNQAAGAIENSKIFEDTLLKAHTDPLTGLWNYGYFQYKLDEEIMKAKNQNYSLSVMMIDLDDFKKYNDAFGHPEGDKVLKMIANILKETCRKIDIVVRYGGEEFALILPYANRGEAKIIGERIRKAVEESKIFTTNFTISIGIASLNHEIQTKEELIRKADSALYQAKGAGKNRVVLA
jgi:diguanylate cyclase (GGDEF)-like protein